MGESGFPIGADADRATGGEQVRGLKLRTAPLRLPRLIVPQRVILILEIADFYEGAIGVQREAR